VSIEDEEKREIMSGSYEWNFLDVSVRYFFWEYEISISERSRAIGILGIHVSNSRNSV